MSAETRPGPAFVRAWAARVLRNVCSVRRQKVPKKMASISFIASISERKYDFTLGVDVIQSSLALLSNNVSKRLPMQRTILGSSEVPAPDEGANANLGGSEKKGNRWGYDVVR